MFVLGRKTASSNIQTIMNKQVNLNPLLNSKILNGFIEIDHRMMLSVWNVVGSYDNHSYVYVIGLVGERRISL